MISLARAKTPFPARAAKPSKRAAIIDVPSLAPSRFSLPPRSFRRIKVKVRRRGGGAARRDAAPKHGRDFSGRATFFAELADARRREEKRDPPVPRRRASYDRGGES